MFCPEGYRSAAELWHEYQQQRLEAIYRSATKSYKDHVEKFSFIRGSPLDICEFLFLLSLCEVGIFVASPSGNVLRLFVKLEDGEHSLFSVLSPRRAALVSASTSLDQNFKEGVLVFGNNSFAPWSHELAEQDSWILSYPELSEKEYETLRHREIPHHTLPFHFIRGSFLIADMIPPWATELAGDAAVKPIRENYAGWSICISEAAYAGKWQEYLKGHKPVFKNVSLTETTAKRGRPRLDLAYSAFQKMGFDRGSLSWAQLAAKIQRETGQSPSAKSLRNWRDAAIETGEIPEKN